MKKFSVSVIFKPFNLLILFISIVFSFSLIKIFSIDINHLFKQAVEYTLSFKLANQPAYPSSSLPAASYTFDGISPPSGSHLAYEDWGVSVFSGPSDTGQGEASGTDYNNIASDDSTRWVTEDASSDGEWDAQMYKFYLDQPKADLAQLDLKWTGYGETKSGYSTYFYIWDYNSSAWEQLASNDFTEASDADLTGTISSSLSNYIGGTSDNEVVLMVKTERGFYCGTDTVSYGTDTYSTVAVGDQCWLGENLNIDPEDADNSSCTSSHIKYCHDDSSCSPNCCDTYGGLYTWSDAMCGASTCNGTGSSQPECSTPVQGICPDGWHLPSHYEWVALERQICSDIGNTDCTTEFLYDETSTGWFGQDTTTAEGEGSALAGGCDLWTDHDINNSGSCNNDFATSGLDLLPGGYRYTSGSYHDQGSRAYLWSSTQYDSSDAWDRRLYYGRTDVGRYYVDKDLGFSVRCLRDSNSLYTNFVQLVVAYTKSDGQTCEDNSECSSGYCVDGYCCDTACTGANEECDVSGSEGICTAITETSSSQASKKEVIQIPGSISNLFVNAIFTKPIKDSNTKDQQVLSIIFPGTFGFNAYLSANYTSPSVLANLKESTDSSTTAGNLLSAGWGSDKLIGFQQADTFYWQVGHIQKIYYKAYPAAGKSAPIIIPAVQEKESIIILDYQETDLYPPGAPDAPFAQDKLKLAYSDDGLDWQIMPSSAVDLANKIVAAIARVGGYYMIVGSY